MICNAWGVFDPSLEPPEVPYANNPLHPVAVALRWLELLCTDIVFAAGNCGQFCPNARCHPNFTGPGRSINGANALGAVLTVGAVRTDRLWLGFSGQGPGIDGMEHDKPDLCAPSQFANEDDAGPTPAPPRPAVWRPAPWRCFARDGRAPWWIPPTSATSCGTRRSSRTGRPGGDPGLVMEFSILRRPPTG